MRVVRRLSDTELEIVDTKVVSQHKLIAERDELAKQIAGLQKHIDRINAMLNTSGR